MRMPIVSVRMTEAERSQLARLGDGNVSSAVRLLIAEKGPELVRESDLIGALDRLFRKLTIAVTALPDGTTEAIVKAFPRSKESLDLAELAVVETRERGGQVAVELVGQGEYEGTRCLLVVLPLGRAVVFEVIPSELTPA